MLAVISIIEDDDQKSVVEQWYRQYYRVMLKEAYHITEDLEIAKDMVNEAFVKILRNYERIVKFEQNSKKSGKKCSKIGFYFVGITRSVSIDYMRKQKLSPKTIEFDFETVMDSQIIEDNNAKTPEDILITNENVEKVAKAIGKLNERDIMLITQKYCFDKTDSEIGEFLGIKPRNVHVYVKRACNKLLSIMNGDGNDEK